jgi:hypothetical protein
MATFWWLMEPVVRFFLVSELPLPSFSVGVIIFVVEPKWLLLMALARFIVALVGKA